MIKKSLAARAAVVTGASIALLIGMSTEAYAANKTFNLEDSKGRVVGKMTHIDKGDKFRVYDTRKDGYGVTGKLFSVSDNGNVSLLDSRYNGGGAGTSVTFQVNIYEGERYQMQLCHKKWGCDTVSVAE